MPRGRPKGSRNKPNPVQFQLTVEEKDIPASIREVKWMAEIADYCKKEGFEPSQLIEKFEVLKAEKLQFDNKIGALIQNSSHVTESYRLTPEQIVEKFGPTEATNNFLNKRREDKGIKNK